MSKRTKWALADKLIALTGTTPIYKIKVKDLCEACGIDRTTFYHHFCDKYDLVCWIFEQYYEDEAGTALTLNDEGMLCRINSRIYRQRSFFADAFQDTAQNNLRQS